LELEEGGWEEEEGCLKEITWDGLVDTGNSTPVSIMHIAQCCCAILVEIFAAHVLCKTRRQRRTPPAAPPSRVVTAATKRANLGRRSSAWSRVDMRSRGLLSLTVAHNPRFHFFTSRKITSHVVFATVPF
jgi:hypothetical protein